MPTPEQVPKARCRTSHLTTVTSTPAPGDSCLMNDTAAQPVPSTTTRVLTLATVRDGDDSGGDVAAEGTASGDTPTAWGRHAHRRGRCAWAAATPARGRRTHGVAAGRGQPSATDVAMRPNTVAADRCRSRHVIGAATGLPPGRGGAWCMSCRGIAAPA